MLDKMNNRESVPMETMGKIRQKKKYDNRKNKTTEKRDNKNNRDN